MTENDFLPKTYIYSLEKGSVGYQAPSNIALVKYWGKYGEQLPKNASISFTLSNCNTKTKLSFEKIEPSENYIFEVYLDGKREEGFEPKIAKFFQRIETFVPFVKNYKFKIETTNSFPHSSGIASSASGMSALSMCLIELENKLLAKTSTEISDAQLKKASFLARLGSGSACRSLEGDLVVWGEHENIKGSTNLFGIKYPYNVHENFQNYQDTILLVDKGEKQVSSTVGHDLMHDHPFAEQRFEQANNNLSKLITVLENGNFSEFIKIVESEALSLHAMMMTSMPYFILMKPNTLQIINKIWEYRRDTKSNVCFTLDAGANVHVLFPENEKESIDTFIKNELAEFCKNGEYISDHVGFGAVKL